MQEVGGSRHSPAADVDADVEACCSLLAQLLVDMWQRAGPAASFPLASLLLQRWASVDDMLCKPFKVFVLHGIATAHVLTIIYDALSQYTSVSPAIIPPRENPDIWRKTCNAVLNCIYQCQEPQHCSHPSGCCHVERRRRRPGRLTSSKASRSW